MNLVPGSWARSGHLDAAQRLFFPDSREGKHGLAWVASLRADHAASLRLSLPLTQSEGAGAFQHEAKALAGRALMRLGQLDEAVVYLREAAQGNGAQAGKASYELGCSLYRLGKHAAALDVMRTVVKEHVGSAAAVRAKARRDIDMKWRKGRREKARFQKPRLALRDIDGDIAGQRVRGSAAGSVFV